MHEVEKHQAEKKELEAILSGEKLESANPNEGFADDRGPDNQDMMEMQAAAQNKPDRNMKVCEVCGALQSASDKEDRLQMHLEGKLHQGYQKIREKLRELRDKQRYDDRRRGGQDRGGRRRFSRSRSRDRLRKEAEEKLAEEAKEHFYYSSNRWGAGTNMPKLGSIFDQEKIIYLTPKGKKFNQIYLKKSKVGGTLRLFVHST